MEKKTTVSKTVQHGITFGSALAMVISYVNWHSIGWAIIHGILSWGYVIYYVIRYQEKGQGEGNFALAFLLDFCMGMRYYNIRKRTSVLKEGR